MHLPSLAFQFSTKGLGQIALATGDEGDGGSEGSRILGRHVSETLRRVFLGWQGTRHIRRGHGFGLGLKGIKHKHPLQRIHRAL